MNYVITGIVGIAVGLLGGYFVFNTPAPGAMEAMDDHGAIAVDDDHVAMDDHGAMDHKMIEVDAAKPIPTVTLAATKDRVGGYNINVVATNFTFTPDKTGQAATANEGHAHVYVNGVKVGRLYGAWMHVDGKHFKDGENTIEVTLNANDHSDWTKGGEKISATQTVTQ